MFLKYYWDNLVRELDNSPALLILFSIVLLIKFIFGTFGFFSIVCTIILSCVLVIAIKDYKRRY